MDIRRRILGESGSSAPSGAVDKTAATPGSICISNGTDIYFISLANWQSYTGAEYQAIGVTVAAVGDCNDMFVRVCSIPFMDCNNPDIGSFTYQHMAWNGYYINIGGGITETTNYSTALYDYKGKSNTTAILAKATGQSNWRIAATITNTITSTINYYFPAACCCWRFHTLGTNQGDWYLPAAGELYKGYQNRTAIEPSLQALGMTYAYSRLYWSSTSYSSERAWQTTWYNSSIGNDARYQAYGDVRAFVAF